MIEPQVIRQEGTVVSDGADTLKSSWNESIVNVQRSSEELQQPATRFIPSALWLVLSRIGRKHVTTQQLDSLQRPSQADFKQRSITAFSGPSQGPSLSRDTNFIHDSFHLDISSAGTAYFRSFLGHHHHDSWTKSAPFRLRKRKEEGRKEPGIENRIHLCTLQSDFNWSISVCPQWISS